MRVFRWKAIGTLVGLLVLVVALWVVFLDAIARSTIAAAGEQVVGAKVDIGKAHVQLRAGRVALTDLHVANPFHPMRNLVDAAEVVAMVRPAPLLERKIIVDSIVIRGMRFDTPRRTSGQLDRPSSEAGLILRRVDAWADQIRIPSLSLEGLGHMVDTRAVSVDSLRTIREAKRVVHFADSARVVWEAQVRALDPRPKIDSARTLVDRLRQLDVRALGVDGLRQTVQTAQATISALTGTLEQTQALERGVDSGVARIRTAVNGLDEARRADYAYARSLLKLPSLDAPDISPALFGQSALDRLKPLLYWLQMGERYLPPGLQARLHPGPKRARMAGTTVIFPEARALPQFLLQVGHADLAIGGTGAAAGDYVAQVSGFTTEPALYGRPARFTARRSAGRVGPRDVRVTAMLDHAATPVRDSLDARAAGFSLPTIDLPGVQARLDLGDGTSELALFRTGAEVSARWALRSSNITWRRLVDSSAVAAGLERELEDLLWRTVSGIKEVAVEAAIRGSLLEPVLSVRSNVGDQLAQSLKRQLGSEIQRAEQRVRATVDSLVQDQLAAARARLGKVQSEVQTPVAADRSDLETVRGELQARLLELTGGIPGLPKLPLPLPLPR